MNKLLLLAGGLLGLVIDQISSASGAVVYLGGQRIAARKVAGASIAIARTDRVVSLTTSSSGAVLPAVTVDDNGWIVSIKDGAGDAGTNNHAVTCTGGAVVDQPTSATTKSIATNGGVLHFVVIAGAWCTL